MLRSLFSGISGLRSHQQMMDVVGNNIANVNTTGFKSSQTVFEDTLSQMMRAAGAPQSPNGGTNPAQVGLGVRTAAINTNFGQGSAQSTGRSTDLMISGDGFFVVNQGGEQLFTRAGAFSFDANGLLVDPQGGVVQGWTAKNGAVNTNASAGGITLPIGVSLSPVATTKVTLDGNLPGDAAVAGNPIVTSITTYDSHGNKVPLSISFVKTATDTWDCTISDGNTSNDVTQSIAFDPATGGATVPPPTPIDFHGVAINVGTLTNFSGASTVAATGQDGSAQGNLQSFTISPDGTLIGVFSNGLKQPLGQIALATFNNDMGLEKAGNSDYRATVNSGTAQVGTAGSSGRGMIQSGMLEMSNVDLGQEFSNLIIAQRGFQANSKVITASDELLQDVVNLKR